MIIKVCKFVVGFKICEGYLIGCKVILCGECMWDFLECLIFIVFLCVCDFCGVSVKFFDGCGNYSMGVCE